MYQGCKIHDLGIILTVTTTYFYNLNSWEGVIESAYNKIWIYLRRAFRVQGLYEEMSYPAVDLV